VRWLTQSASTRCAATPSPAACSNPQTLARAIERLGFLQADPIRAPARAQDLILRHRVNDYHAGDLERRYPRLKVKEDFFVNYGFVPDAIQALMHPRTPRTRWSKKSRERLRRFSNLSASGVRRTRVKSMSILRMAASETGLAVHRTQPRSCSISCITGAWCRWCAVTAARVCTRRTGMRRRRPTAASSAPRLDALVDVIVKKYAPLHGAGLGFLIRRIRYGAPQWMGDITGALARARERLAHAQVDGVEWFWPADENPASRKYLPKDTCACWRRSIRRVGPQAL